MTRPNTAFVLAGRDALDLADLGFADVEPAATGRPGYHPSAMLKLFIYSYLNRIQSSRRLQREARRNLEVIWLLRRLAPDDKTIADFRRQRPGDQEGLREVCRPVPDADIAVTLPKSNTTGMEAKGRFGKQDFAY